MVHGVSAQARDPKQYWDIGYHGGTDQGQTTGLWMLGSIGLTDAKTLWLDAFNINIPR